MDIIYKLLERHIVSHLNLKSAKESLDVLTTEAIVIKSDQGILQHNFEVFDTTTPTVFSSRPRISGILNDNNRQLTLDAIETEQTNIGTIKSQLECFFENKDLVDEICKLNIQKYNYWNYYKQSLDNKDHILNAEHVISRNLQMYQKVNEELMQKIKSSRL